MKFRKGSDGLHLFERSSGLNCLIDEVVFPKNKWAKAPRFVSMALTNICDLSCRFCYAPKSNDFLTSKNVLAWSRQLDSNGCLCIGFGGGEPTLHRDFTTICREINKQTALGITFTTHGHHLDETLCDELDSSVNFVRVSMDGVGETYESIRKKSFSSLLAQLKLVSSKFNFGINYVVNDQTLPDLDRALDLIVDVGAQTLLLLPEHLNGYVNPLIKKRLASWIKKSPRPINISVSENGVDDTLPIANPFNTEVGVNGYAHVTAKGEVSRTSFDLRNTIKIDPQKSIISALDLLRRDTT